MDDQIEQELINELTALHQASSGTRIMPEELMAYALNQLLRFYKSIHYEKFVPRADFLRWALAGMDGFRDALPEVVFSGSKPKSLSTIQRIDLAEPNRALIKPFGKITFDKEMYPPYHHDFDEPEPKHDWDECRRNIGRLWADADDYKRFVEDWRKEWKDRKREYEKNKKQAPPLTAQEEQTIGTVFFRQARYFATEAQITVPFVIPQQNRFAHQFILGPSRSGKTTFLTTQIVEDLRAAARRECSVIVMDSHNELIPQLLKLNFGVETIYLEPSKYPIAMNIFDQGNTENVSKEHAQDLYRAAFETTFFFLNSIARTDVSGHQETVLKFAIQGVMAIPNATVDTLRELLEEGGVEKYKTHFQDLDSTVRDWLLHALNPKNKDYGPSVVAVRNRLAGLVVDPLFRQMFRHPKNKLDLFELLRTPKAILINTAGLGDATGPFGRFIIAKLEEATSKRRFVPQAEKLPVYAYIDEASDYISDEPKVASMIDKLGKQNLGLIFATQREAHIHDANVLDALKNVSIQCVTKRPNVYISIDGAEPAEVSVAPVDLSTLAQISEQQLTALRANMQKRFAPDTELPPQQATSKPSETAEEPDHPVDTDAKPWPKK